MMAFDRTPSQPNLDSHTIEALRVALTKSATDGNHSDDLRGVLCKASDDARQKGLPAERLLVILKDLWYSLPEVSNATSTSQNALLQELISRCIQEYYAL
jgi:hypothetical protein